MKQLIISFLLISTLFILPRGVAAQPRYAECDACGYCINREAPQSWNACAKCFYPTLVSDTTLATQNKTLEIILTPIPDPDNPNQILVNRPPVPAKGKYYTQLGCLDVGMSSFSDPLAAGGLLNFILTRLLFPIVGVLAFLAIIYGAFLLITGQDNPEQIGRGKAWVYGAIIGVIFVISAVFIVQTIASDILKIPGFNRGSPVTMNIKADCATVGCPKINLYVNAQPLPNTYPIPTTWQQTAKDKAAISSGKPGIQEIKSGLIGDTAAGNVFIEFDNDYWASGDKNITINSFVWGKQKCVQYSALLRNASSGQLSTYTGKTMPFYIDGIAMCTAWQPL